MLGVCLQELQGIGVRREPLERKGGYGHNVRKRHTKEGAN